MNQRLLRSMILYGAWVLMLTGSFACINKSSTSSLSANTEPPSADSCSVRSAVKNPEDFLQRLAELDNVCRQAVLEKIPLRNLYQILPVANVDLPTEGLIRIGGVKNGLQIIARKKFENFHIWNLDEQFFRISDDRFATLRKVNDSSLNTGQDMVSRFDIWEVNSPEVKTVEMEIGQNLNGKFYPRAVNMYLQAIINNGVSIDLNELNGRTWGLGPLIDRDTRLVLGLRTRQNIEISLMSENYAKKLPFIVPEYGENGSMNIGESSIVAEHFLQKTGDIIVRKRRPEDGIALFNIWTMLEAYVAESQKNEKCGI